jgi:phytol kinase
MMEISSSDENDRGSIDYDSSDDFDLNPVLSDDEDMDTRPRHYSDVSYSDSEKLSKSGDEYDPFKIGDDQDAKEEALEIEGRDTKVEKHNVKNIIRFEKLGIYGIILLLYTTMSIVVSMGHIHWLPMVDRWFLLYISLFFGIFFFVAVAGGIFVKHWGVNVMYTRKFIHFFSFFLPFTLFHIIPFEKTITTYSLTCCSLFLSYVPLVESFRVDKGVYKIFYYAFLSFDRPNDPFTLLWSVTQSFFAFVVMLPIGIVLSGFLDAKDFVSIPIMTVAIGDGLAEIIGRNFGYHKFRTTAMCTLNEYTRSVEGSLCVFFSCVITILIVSLVLTPHIWNLLQITIACLTLPLAMTIMEALAPHSWDNALLLLTGGIGTILVFLINPGAEMGEIDESAHNTTELLERVLDEY